MAQNTFKVFYRWPSDRWDIALISLREPGFEAWPKVLRAKIFWFIGYWKFNSIHKCRRQQELALHSKSKTVEWLRRHWLKTLSKCNGNVHFYNWLTDTHSLCSCVYLEKMWSSKILILLFFRDLYNYKALNYKQHALLSEHSQA